MNKALQYSVVLQLAVAGVAFSQTTQPADRSTRSSDQSHTGLLGIGKDANQVLPSGLIRASQLIGTEVYNRQGKHLGEIKDVVLDQDHKRIGYAVLSYGGIAGLGDKLFAMPKDMVQYSPGESKAYVELDEQTLRNAPGFDRSKWPSEANADYYKKLDTYYGDKARHGADQASHEAQTAGDRMSDAADHTGDKVNDAVQHPGDTARDIGNDANASARQAGQRMENAADRTGDAARNAGDRATGTMDDMNKPLDQKTSSDQQNVSWNRRVSSLIGANVENNNGDNLGEVKDIVLDWQGGKVRYAVLSYGGILGFGDKLFAVPIESFTSQPGSSSKLVLNVNKDQLKNAPGFDQNHWPDMADKTWSKSVSDFYQQNQSGDRDRPNEQPAQ